jgi:hypothetical protein
MLQSPYRQTVHAPINDLDEYSDDLHRARSRIEYGGNNQETLLEYGETLLERCDFLDAKLCINVRIHS